MSYRFSLPGFFMAALLNPLCAQAMEITSFYQEATPIFPSTLRISLSGEMVAGDAEALVTELEKFEHLPLTDINFQFDSPGGSLNEGLLIGRLISILPYDTTASIAGSDRPICASSCVYSFLGADYRYISENAELGVHQFYMAEKLDGDEALAIGQELSSKILSYLNDREVDTEFMTDIVSARGNDIVWMDHQRLAELRVVSQGVRKQDVDYVNDEGEISLRITQDAYVGHNRMLITCGRNGPYGLAVLQEPLMPPAGPLMVFSNGADHTVFDYNYIEHGDGETLVSFTITPQLAAVIATSSGIGVKVWNMDKTMSYGFVEEVIDPKIGEMVNGCMQQSFKTAASAPPPAPAPAPAPAPTRRMERHPLVDILGADLTENGIRNISMDQCELQCMAYSDCLAVSYVIDKQWCWPKGAGGQITQSEKVMSSFR